VLLNCYTFYKAIEYLGAALANFAIMRIEKRKDIGSVRRCAAHHLRTAPTPNADPNRGIKVLTGSSDPNDVTMIINGVASDLMKRKDAIRAMDVFCGASPEFFAQGGSIREFEAIALAWASETFGPDNIVLAVTHEDESTPHVQMLITPVTPAGKLSASHWLDGPKKLRALQNSFADAMKPLGLERGIEGSKAKHEDIKTFYGKLEPAAKQAKATIDKAEEVQILQTAREAKIVAGASQLAQAEAALMARQKQLEDASDALQIEQREVAQIKAEIVRKETFLSKLTDELQAQKKGLLKIMNKVHGLIPEWLRAELKNLFPAENSTPPAGVKIASKAVLETEREAPRNKHFPKP
jgi:hypothetical protein